MRKAFESVSMGLLPMPNWMDLDRDRLDCEAIEWAWRLDKRDRDAQKEAQGGAGMKDLAQSCKITIGNADTGHTVHFPDGWNEHVEARPFEDIDGVIERAAKQREEWEELMERSRFLEQNKDKKAWIVNFPWGPLLNEKGVVWCGNANGTVALVSTPFGAYPFEVVEGIDPNNLDVDNIIERAVSQKLIREREASKSENPATPSYYRFRIKGIECDVFDIAKAAGLTPAETMALKYLLRAELEKAHRFIDTLSDVVSEISLENREKILNGIREMAGRPMHG